MAFTSMNTDKLCHLLILRSKSVGAPLAGSVPKVGFTIKLQAEKSEMNLFVDFQATRLASSSPTTCWCPSASTRGSASSASVAPSAARRRMTTRLERLYVNS